jgi:hypothetical protein
MFISTSFIFLTSGCSSLITNTVVGILDSMTKIWLERRNSEERKQNFYLLLFSWTLKLCTWINCLYLPVHGLHLYQRWKEELCESANPREKEREREKEPSTNG